MIFCLSAPSGTGKTSLIRELLASHEDFIYPISVTTRPPRPNEIDGYDYFFISLKEFEDLQKKDAFLECANVFGNLYGTLKNQVLGHKNKHVILDMDWQGVSRIAISMIKIFVLPPSLAVLRQRLQKRGQNSEEDIKKRIAAAKVEISYARNYDYIIVNEDFFHTLDCLKAIITAESMRSANVKIPKYV